MHLEFWWIILERDYHKFNFSTLLVKSAASQNKHTQEDRPEKKAKTT
jgi:hypothetical protein